MSVLVLAREFDPTADAVITALGDRGVAVLRTDLSDFPTRLRLEARMCGGRWSGRLWNNAHSVRLEGIRAIWHRAPSTYRFPDTLSAAVREFCYREAKLGLGGVLAALPVLWANHPNRCADAIFKPYQWQLATDCGLTVADTVITNDPAAAGEFLAERPGQAITKALGPAGITENGQTRVAYTRRITPADTHDLGAVAATATVLQQFVPKAFEVRLTVIGHRMFPIAIHADSPQARIDWRSDPHALRYEPIELPASVADAVSRYLARAGLRYAGLDFVVTPEGRWVMLEANSGPQFGWLEAATGMPIVAAMAAMLAEGTP